MRKLILLVLVYAGLSYTENLPIYSGTDTATRVIENGVSIDSSFRGQVKFAYPTPGNAIWGVMKWPAGIGSLQFPDGNSASWDTLYNVAKATSWEACELNLYADDSLFGYRYNVVYIYRNFNWVQLCSLTTYVRGCFDNVKAKDSELYILKDSTLYKVSRTGSGLISIISSPKVIGFNFDNNNKIWFTSNNTLSRCDLDGSNSISIKSSSIYTTMNCFVVNPLDTSVIYRGATDRYTVYGTRHENGINNLNGCSISDSIKWFLLDLNNDIWFGRTNKITNYYELYKYDTDDTNSITSYIALRKNTNFVMNPTKSNEYAYEARGDTGYVHHLNHKPRFKQFIASNLDSICYNSEINRTIHYTCSLKVADDNIADLPIFVGLSQPTWLNIISAGTHNATAICTTYNVPVDTGTYTIRVLVKDGWSSPMSDTIQWIIRVYSRQLNITTPTIGTASADNHSYYLQNIDFTTYNNDSVKYVSQLSTKPAWLQIARTSATSYKVYRPAMNTVPTGTYPIQLIFADSTYMNYDTISWNLTYTSYPLLVTSSIDSFANEGSPYSQTLTFNDTVFYGSLISPKPSWMSVSKTAWNTYVLSGTPTTYGDTLIWIRFKDEASIINNDTVKYTLHVAHVNHKPTISTSPTISGTENQVYSYDVNASDADVIDTLFYQLNSKPSGMTIDSTTGIISWTPNYFQSGAYNIVVCVRDKKILETYGSGWNSNDTVLQSYTLTIANVNRAPVISNNDTTINLIQGDSVSITVHGTDVDLTTLTFSNTSYNVISRQDSAFKIKPNHSGKDSVYLIVSDGTLQDSMKVILNIQAPQPSIRPIALVIPKENYVSQNYPNPCNPITNIGYGVKSMSNVSIGIYDIKGQLIIQLLNESKAAGTYSVTWDGVNYQGKKINSGMYFYKVKIGDNFSNLKRLTIIK